MSRTGRAQTRLIVYRNLEILRIEILAPLCVLSPGLGRGEVQGAGEGGRGIAVGRPGGRGEDGGPRGEQRLTREGSDSTISECKVTS